MNRAENDCECCPRLDPEKWDKKLHLWDEKNFIKGSVFTFFFMPVNFGRVITRLCKKAEEAGATTPDNICLSDHTSKWNMDIYLATDKEIQGANNTKLNGKYLSRVYEGDFRKTGEWYKDFEKYLREEGHDMTKTYMWYTTCPKCAKKYGKNYVVIFGKIS